MKQPVLTAEELGVKREKLSIDFIAGLIVGEGYFYWTKDSGGRNKPGFGIRMHIRDFDLLMNVRDSLYLDERVYEYTHNNRHYAMLLIRDVADLKNKIIPTIGPKLTGYKREQFIKWFRQFKAPDTHPGYQFIGNIFKQSLPWLYN